MQLSIKKIKELRTLRAWTQSQLAEIANLSLRTVQRIEKAGHASPESTKSICAAFDIKVDDILHRQDSNLSIANSPSFFNRHKITKKDVQISAWVAIVGFIFSFTWNLL